MVAFGLSHEVNNYIDASIESWSDNDSLDYHEIDL